MFKFKTYVLKRMNMPFTIAFVRVDFDEMLIDELNQVVNDIDKYLKNVEEKFSPFLPDSLVSRHTDLGEELQDTFFDLEYQEVYSRSIIAKKETQGLFDPFYDGKYNPTGFVKGWAIENAFMKYIKPLIDNNIIEAGAINGAGDIQVGTRLDSDFSWEIGIENPENKEKIIAKYSIKNGAVATSGLSKKGQHIKSDNDINYVQVTVVGTYLSDVDVLATAGVVSDEKIWSEIVESKLLTGILLTKKGIKRVFEEGKIMDVERT
ncbi:FAD:protein FMN transferase [Gemella haemolysans]|nr:FAD:protein FMN transferase [Gemella haemolysans]KAA8706775.1 FAD:protein FMN transferase [Gemella haemolysans]UBH82569.1 FAD:protein FMN transferase [Gemella haemolysans]VEI39178.1 ApbE family [Gemella haemolysans]